MTETKIAVVLGTGPGLGAAIAHRFAREGFALGLMARDKGHVLQADLGKPQDVAAFVAFLASSDAD